MDGTLVIYIFLLVRALSKKTTRTSKKGFPTNQVKKTCWTLQKKSFLINYLCTRVFDIVDKGMMKNKVTFILNACTNSHRTRGEINTSLHKVQTPFHMKQTLNILSILASIWIMCLCFNDIRFEFVNNLMLTFPIPPSPPIKADQPSRRTNSGHYKSTFFDTVGQYVWFYLKSTLKICITPDL